MPMYEYKCDQCGQLFEVIQRFSDEPLKTHEGCGGSVERLISAPALQFKGSGWYITDYARSGGGGNAADPSAKNGGSGSEAKPSTGSSESSSSSSATPSTPSSSSTSDTKK